MRHIRSILVAIKTPRASAPALTKAVQIARGLDADLEIFHAIDQPLYVDVVQPGNLTPLQFERLERTRYRSELEALAAPLRDSGLRVSTAAEWDFPAYQAIVRRAERIGADLIVAERHATHHSAPWLLKFNDWELLRLAPVPVLLVKSARKYTRPRILAAVDPLHTLDKPAKLDLEILRISCMLARSLNGSLHAVHAYVPSLIGMSQADLSAVDATERIHRNCERRARQELTRLLRRSAVRPVTPHLMASHPTDAIPAAARKLNCSLMVMGAISRSGLKRLLIGNTAERVLDELACDLLIVKPPGFKSRVARAPRGPHVALASAPYQAI